MNDFDLESKLRSVRVPARTEDYWETFPQQVRAQLRPTPEARSAQNAWRFHFAWGSGVAFACLVIGLSLWYGHGQLEKSPVFAMLKNGKTIRGELAQISNRLRVFMQNEHGMHYLVADEE